MQQITQYKANDGTIFSDKQVCETYEKQCLEIEAIMQFMGPKPKDKGCTFANGGGYIPHDIKLVKQARTELTVLGRKILNIKENVGFGIIGRYFDDSGNRVLYAAWNRLSNCDEQGREWGQGYYAFHPDKGVQEIFTDK